MQAWHNHKNPLPLGNQVEEKKSSKKKSMQEMGEMAKEDLTFLWITISPKYSIKTLFFGKIYLLLKKKKRYKIKLDFLSLKFPWKNLHQP